MAVKIHRFVSSNVLRNVLVLVFVIFAATACKQIFSFEVVRFANKSSYMVTAQTLQTVDRSFYAAFYLGNWRYKGANATYGEVNAYIQIPEKLDLDVDVQRQYIKQVLCPNKGNLDLWHQLKHVDLQLHIYTQARTKSISATCRNPLKEKIIGQV